MIENANDLIALLSSGTVGTAVIGSVAFGYKKYQELVQKLEDRPTKQETDEMIKDETDKMLLRFDHLNQRLDALHSDVSEIRDYLLNAARTSTKNTPNLH